jgi:phosphonate transport system substrate-binding protein
MVMVPSQDPDSTAPAAERVAALLADELGYPVYAYVPDCYGGAVEALATGDADVGWLPAVAYVVAHDWYGVDVKLAIERHGFAFYRGQFLVRNDSGISDLAGLAGGNFAFSDPLSTSSFMYPAVHISNTQGMTYATFFNETVFAGSHSDVVRAVYHGDHEGTPIHGGATFEDARWTVVDELPDVFTETKVLTYTPWIPNDTVSVRPGLDVLVAQEVISGLLAIADTPEGQQALDDLYSIGGLAPADDAAYDYVRDVVAAFGLEFESCSESTGVGIEMGGTLVHESPDGVTTTVEIPPELVTQTLQLSYTPLAGVTYAPAGRGDLGCAFDLRAVVSGTLQTVTSLAGPYTMTVVYGDDQAGWASEGSLALYFWDGEQWVREPSSVVNGADNTIVAAPDHFSRWAVLGTPKVFLPIVLMHE